MKRFALTVAIALGLTACGDTKSELETDMKATLANQMTVTDVQLTADATGNYSGYAIGKALNGLDARRNCSATKSGSTWKWSCISGVDDETLREMEGNIRKGLEDKGEVVEVHLRKGADDDNMVGGATVRVDGETIAATCTAVREPLKTGTNFRWECK